MGVTGTVLVRDFRIWLLYGDATKFYGLFTAHSMDPPQGHCQIPPPHLHTAIIIQMSVSQFSHVNKAIK